MDRNIQKVGRLFCEVHVSVKWNFLNANFVDKFNYILFVEATTFRQFKQNEKS